MTSNQRSILPARNHRLAVLAAVAMATAPRLSRAQGVDDLGSYGDMRSGVDRESAENFALELRLGPYLPHVDSELPEGIHPFQDYFGTKNRVAVGLEFDWLPIAIKDTLRFGAGAGAMYTTMGGVSKMHDPPYGPSGQATSLHVLPHWAAAVLRFDALPKRTTWIPLTFAAKLGLAQSLWWVGDEPKTRAARVDGVDTGISGKGRSYGIYYAAQIMLDLSILEPTRRKRLDSFSGINRIYFFGEFYGLELNNFGASGAMNLSDRTWALGMAFDL